jgi:hypothetical protein
MMWLALIAICFVALGILYFIATERKHKRIKAERKVEAIKNAEERLKRARIEYPHDILLHLNLRENIVRLRNEE